MAFTAGQRDAIAGYLGYAIISENQTLIQSACTTLTGLSADAELRVQSYLSELAQIDTEIETARVTVGSALSQLNGQGRRYCGLLAMTLNLEIRNDYYS